LALVVPLFVASQLVAQPAPAPAPTAAPSGSDQRVGVAALRLHLEDDVARAHRSQQSAKDGKDMIKLSCIDDAMVVLLARTRVAETAFAAFDAAARQPSADLDPLFTGAQRAFADAYEASEELDGCVGSKQVIIIGKPGISVHHDKFDDDPTKDCNNLGQRGCPPALEYVAFASPFSPG
jgi:hypothetical protein